MEREFDFNQNHRLILHTMKKIFYLLFISFITTLSFASTGGGGTGGSTPNACSTANGFCTGTTYNFPNSYGNSSLGGGGIYGCLGSTPNPVWYYMEIDQPGNLDIHISQTNTNGSGIDVDFVLWGPFTSLSSGCNSLSSSNIVDCSYSTAAQEDANIPNAQTGQVYIMLLTNYADDQGNITFSQTGGAGTTNCNVLCDMSALTAVAGACNPATNQYEITGQITFTNPPTVGDLTVSTSGGQSVTIPGPWTSPMSYTIPGNTSNGAAVTVTAVFSDVVTCTMTQNITSPPACTGCTVTPSNTGPVCQGEDFDLTSVINSSTAPTSISWTGPNGFSSSVEDPGTQTSTTAGNQVYNVTVVTPNGTCTGSTTVLVNSLPPVNAGLDQSVCEGTSVTLTATGGVTYQWDNNVTQATAFTPAVGTLTYTVGAVDANGCPGVDQVVVTVNPNPIVSAGPDQNICQGVSVTLSGTGATSYSWNNSVQNGVPFTPTISGTYTIIGTTLAGCTGTDNMNINITPIPIPTLVPDNTIGCMPATFTYTNTSVDLANTFVWDFGDGTTQTGTGPMTHVYPNPGCFNVTLTATTPDGCVGVQAYPSLVCVNQNPISEFSANPGNLNMQNTTSAFTNSSTGASSFIWDFDDATTSTSISPTHTFPNDNPGTYEVMLIAISAEGCVDTSYQIVVVQDELIFYVPNSFTPDGDQYNQTFKPVFTSGFDPFDYHLSIYNRWGELIFESHDTFYGWPGNYGFGNGLCPEGSYTWKLDFKTSLTDARKLYTGSVTIIR